ncbi:hypothetical protein AAFC00_007069 [Neodothiora populina]|uniref:Zn(2)-C6 fungal-type domain-containing protein n=1 Tax=Neodothiora populina TaxID=2781224 RepID=A0ABR3PC30_9PEZI
MNSAPSAAASQSSSRIGKRKAPNACVRCRTRKIKCTGRHPCEKCVARDVPCIFEEKEKRVVVTQGFIDSLRSNVGGSGSGAPDASAVPYTSPAPDDASPSFSSSLRSPVQSISYNAVRGSLMTHSPARSSLHSGLERQGQPPARTTTEGGDADHGLTNTLVDSIPQVRVRGNGQHSHSSTLSFSRRVRNMIQSSDKIVGPRDATLVRDDMTYSIKWPALNLRLDDIDLPPLDFAEYLTSTVTFYAGPLYDLYDKAAFLRRLRAYYGSVASKQPEEPGLWHIQMLLVFALGRAILAREHFKCGPAGTTYFLRALDALPDTHRLYEDPVLSIEILCLLTLFMQAIDAGQEAYGYIGQALRIAIAHGLNRGSEAESVGVIASQHRYKLWWTVYIIDRRACALMGSPSGIHDEDVFLPEPLLDGVSESDFALAMHVKISSLLGGILDIIYGTKNQGRGKFIQGVQVILANLAETSQMLAERLPIETQRPVDTLSRVAATLHLLSHQCIILAVRPVLYSLLSLKLNSSRPLQLPDTINALLRMCVESAFNVLKIIFALKSQNLSDMFLPYDLDAIFSAAFVLILVDIITPATDLLWDLQRVFSYLDEFITREIVSADSLKADLQELLDLHAKLQEREAQRGEQTDDVPRVNDSIAQEQPQDQDQGEQDMIWSWMMNDDGDLRGIHPDTIQSVIDGLNVESMDLPDFDVQYNYNIWGAHST